jgi:hypothetical protein
MQWYESQIFAVERGKWRFQVMLGRTADMPIAYEAAYGRALGLCDLEVIGTYATLGEAKAACDAVLAELEKKEVEV